MNACRGGAAVALAPTLVLRGRRWSAFRFWGTLGYAAAAATAFSVALVRGLSLAWTAGLVSLAVATFFVLALGTKLVTGEERLTFYHHELAVLAGVAWLAPTAEAPALAYLDLAALSIAAFLSLGRLGCLFAGCCYGVPHAFGVRYGHSHAEAGFPRCFVGVRLFPVQLLESLWGFGTLLGGWLLLLRHAPDGAVLAWHSSVYGLGRFGFERLRGDACRPYLGSLSEAQWTTLGIMSATALAELGGALPLELWHVGVTLGVWLAAARIAWAEAASRRLLGPAHVRQLAELLERIEPVAGDTSAVRMGRTTLGVRLSASPLDTPRDGLMLAFSLERGALDGRCARRLATLLSRLSTRNAMTRVTPSATGVCHLVLSARDATSMG